MDKKIAILIADSIYNRKGMMNAELNRIIHLKRIAPYRIDVFTFQTYNGWLVRMLRHQKKSDRPKSIMMDGINVNIEWHKFSLIDYFLTVKFKMRPLFSRNWEFRYTSKFDGYDLIVANSTSMGDLAYNISKKYGIPYYVFWHGSDIHTDPFTNNFTFARTKQVLESAELNFMVSKALEKTSKQIAPDAKTKVLYNGVNSSFKRFSEEERLKLRQDNKVEGKKVVAFAGHLIEVKNPQLFPEIFRSVLAKYSLPIEFWVMGTGKMGGYVESKCKEYNIPLKMWGNVPSHDMPSMLNCVDVLILPSQNEGLPLIAIEAIACGANAVGARVGGIPEAMGLENTFPHGFDFVEDISEHIVYMLNNKVEQTLLPCFSWAESVVAENELYMDYLENNLKCQKS